jgi:hypothetical protein
MAAPTDSAPPRSFWLDLNVFIAIFLLVAGLGVLFIHLPIALLAKAVLPARGAEIVAFPAAYVVLLAALAWVWRRYGMSPVQRDPRKARQFRIGHGLLVLSNAQAALAFLPALLAPVLAGIAQGGLPLPGAVMLVPMLANLAAIAGLLLVFGARATQPQAYADTMPLPALHAATFAGAKPQSGGNRGLVVGGVVFGLLASTVLIGVGLVFASLSYQYRIERFTGVVLPVAIGIYVLYVAGAIWLIGLPLVQVVAMLAGSLLGP